MLYAARGLCLIRLHFMIFFLTLRFHSRANCQFKKDLSGNRFKVHVAGDEMKEPECLWSEKILSIGLGIVFLSNDIGHIIFSFSISSSYNLLSPCLQYGLLFFYSVGLLNSIFFSLSRLVGFKNHVVLLYMSFKFQDMFVFFCLKSK